MVDIGIVTPLVQVSKTDSRTYAASAQVSVITTVALQEQGVTTRTVMATNTLSVPANLILAHNVGGLGLKPFFRCILYQNVTCVITARGITIVTARAGVADPSNPSALDYDDEDQVTGLLGDFKQMDAPCTSFDISVYPGGGTVTGTFAVGYTGMAGGGS